MHTSRSRLALFAASSVSIAALIACGGGGGGDSSSPPLVNFGSTAPLPAAISNGTTTMSCTDGTDWQCSGESILRTDNGVSVTSSGVLAYGRSTSDLLPTNPNRKLATGLEPTSGGTVELRFQRNATTFAVQRAGMILTNLGISWNGTDERPQAIESFDSTAGVTKLVAGKLSTANVLPPSTDLNYYDFAGRGIAATQTNYANNRYFPRTDASRCPITVSPCPTAETSGLTFLLGAFRSGGSDPDRTSAHRLHSDGDMNAGYASLPNNLFPSANGPGVPYPGNKGSRDLVAFSYFYSNLATWVTDETAKIDEWIGPTSNQEYTLNRRGAVAFGVTTTPSAVPAAGGVDYKGVVYGWYTAAGDTAIYFRATASVSVNFDSRQVAIKFSDAKADGTNAALPFAAEITTGLGASGSNVANYFTGAAKSSGADALEGGLGGRFFGPVGSGPATTNQGPAEIAGSFTLKNATSKAAVVGGFIGRRQ